jgi:hypothetical protein
MLTNVNVLYQACRRVSPPERQRVVVPMMTVTHLAVEQNRLCGVGGMLEDKEERSESDRAES